MATLDLTAPGCDPGAVGLPPLRRAVRQGVGYFAPALLFIAIPVYYQWVVADRATAVATTVLAGVLGALYLGSSLVADRSFAFRVAWCAGLLALQVALVLVARDASQFCYYAPYAVLPTVPLLPWWLGRWVVLADTVVGVVLGITGHANWVGLGLLLMTFLMGFTLASQLERERAAATLSAERERNALLAVAAERERIGRDLHDILGHSLTAITVKAELARRLLDGDVAAARVQLEELEQVSRQALADVRATASHLRQVRVATELASARSVLEAAGIVVTAPSALPPVDDATSELLGYALREAVTNVVRHSGASRCTIAVAPDHLAVADDGDGFAGREGNGLTGLRSRLAQAGWALDVDSSARGTTLTATRGGAT